MQPIPFARGNLTAKAEHFARRVHRNHVRVDEARTPYVHHLAEVAELVAASGGTEEEIASAWLHDTVEDTTTALEDIRHEFGDRVAEIVEGLTDLPEWNSLSMAERKVRQAERVAKASENIRRVKLADQTSNVQIVGSGKEFTIERSLAYLAGAQRIAEACAGTSPYLDKLFRERYCAAAKNLKTLQSLSP